MNIDRSWRPLVASYLGLVPYEDALTLQRILVTARSERRIPDSLLLLQHPHVFTLGRFRGERDLLVSPNVLSEEAIGIYKTDRGGSITYHGPGQLVGYPIIDLRENHISVSEYIHNLEELIIKALRSLRVESNRKNKHVGVWVGERKVCSIGIRLLHHVTMHGFALNVNCDLSYFDYINPCGLKSSVMTSLARETGDTIGVEDIVETVIESFSEVFQMTYQGENNLCLMAADSRPG